MRVPQRAGAQGVPVGAQAGARCPACGASFACGCADPQGCWCMRRPPLPAALRRADAGCLCPACLDRRLRAAADGAPGEPSSETASS